MDPNQFSTHELVVYFQRLFEIGDTNQDGVLQPQEFANLLKRCGFDLPPHLILRMVRDADTNEDGVIDFQEFMPSMLALMQQLSTGQLPPPKRPVNQNSFRDVNQSSIQDFISHLFEAFDTNGDGVIQPTELLDLLESCGLHFPPSIVLEIFLTADVDESGAIDFEEFVPVALAIIEQATTPRGLTSTPTVNGANLITTVAVPPVLQRHARISLTNKLFRDA